eukprot:546545-Alexandrium_andersonii.AAC.1
MSASLVGSEMCIRDSISSAPIDMRRGPLGGRMGSLQGSPTGSWRPYTCCLLYTSDAADDM